MTATTLARTETNPIFNRSAWSVIWRAGVVCGVLDITAAFISAYLTAGMMPFRVLQAVASAVFGKGSYDLGFLTMAFGLGLHFAVAFSWTTLFYALSKKRPALLRHAVVSGMIYGAVVYGMMNTVMLPFAAWFRSFYLPTPFVYTAAKFAIPQFCIHLTCVGLAISLMVKKCSR